MSPQKHQHIVPRFYLKGFVNDNTFTKYKKNGWDIDTLPLQVYSKETNQIKERGINKLFSEKYYYSYENNDLEMDHYLENKLSGLESKFSRLIDFFNSTTEKTILSDSTFDISDQDRLLLAEYIEWQIKRVPVFVEEVKDNVKNEFKNIHQLFNVPISENDLDKKTRKSTLGILNKIGESGNIKAVIFNKNIIVFKICDIKYCSFITTDNPISIFNNIKNQDGLANPGAQILFPLNRNICLFLYDFGKNSIFVKIREREKAKRINLYIAHKFHNYIVGNSKQQLEGIIKSLRNYQII